MNKNIVLLTLALCIIFLTGCKQEYDVTFMSIDQEVYQVIESVDNLVDEVRLVEEGYIFTGWYYDIEFNELAEFPIEVTEDIILYPKYEEITYTVTVMLDSELEYEVTHTDNQINTSTDLLGEEVDLTKEGYIFTGWYYDSEYNELVEFPIEVREDIVLYPKYDKVICTITFVLDGLVIKEYPVTELTNHLNTYVDLLSDTEDGYLYYPISNSYNERIVEDTIIEVVKLIDYDYYTDGTIIDIQNNERQISFLTDTGRLYLIGNNDSWGHIFDPDDGVDDILIPIDITGYFDLHEGETIKHVGVGLWESFIVTSENRVFIYVIRNHSYYNSSGTIEEPEVIDLTGLLLLEEGEYIVKVDADSYYHYAFTSNNRLLTWSYQYGALCQTSPDYEEKCATLQDEYYYFDSTLYLDLETDEYIVDFSTTSNHLIILTNQSKLYGFGSTRYGELGLLSIDNINSYYLECSDSFTFDSIDYIFAGHRTTYIVTEHQEIIVSGYLSGFYELEQGTTLPTTIDINIKGNIVMIDDYNRTIIVDDLGNVYMWGNKQYLSYQEYDEDVVFLINSLYLDGNLVDTCISYRVTFFLTSEGTVIYFGEE